MPNTVKRLRNAKGRYLPGKPIDVTTESQIPALESMLSRGPVTFVLIYADWCGHCQRYKPMWERLTRTPGRIANMASVRDDMFKKVPAIKNAEINGYPSVIKVRSNGSIERYNVNGENTNAMDSTKMRDMANMTKEIKTVPDESTIASNTSGANYATNNNTTNNNATNNNATNNNATNNNATNNNAANNNAANNNAANNNATNNNAANNNATNNNATAYDESVDIYTPVTSLANMPGFQRGTLARQAGGALSVAAAFTNAVQSVGPVALLLAAHSLLPKRSRTFKSPKRSSHRGGTRRTRRYY
jgi:thiol-disulfide isomerase/thioredoxin